MKRILDPTFEYTNAASTDIRKTFRRERKRLADLKAAEEAKREQQHSKVTILNKRAK